MNNKQQFLHNVNKNGLNLEFASKDLQNDKTIVLTAVTQNT